MNDQPSSHEPGVQQPTEPHHGVHPAPAAGSASRGPKPMIVGLTGALAGAVLVGAVWLGTSLAGGPRDAGDDAAAACDLLGELPELTDARMAPADAYRVSAAYGLAEAAAVALAPPVVAKY